MKLAKVLPQWPLLFVLSACAAMHQKWKNKAEQMATPTVNG